MDHKKELQKISQKRETVLIELTQAEEAVKEDARIQSANVQQTIDSLTLRKQELDSIAMSGGE